MRLLPSQQLAQAGDTIVEVLIALAIVSLILVGAFVTSNRSVRSTRDSQEHSEASQVLKSQIELVRTMVAGYTDDATDPLTTGTSLFCIDLNKPSVPTQLDFPAGYGTGGGKVLLPIATDTFSAYPPGCSQSAGGFKYYIVVENNKTNPAAVPPNTLLFVARWDKLGGGRDEVNFTYRIHAIVAGSKGTVATGTTGTTSSPSCSTFKYSTNAITNGDFSQSLATGNSPHVDQSLGDSFSSGIPYRGANLYPDDGGQNAPNKNWFGGFTMYSSGDVHVAKGAGGNGPAQYTVQPYGVWGTPLPNNTIPGKNITSYFYSNPVQAYSAGSPSVFPNPFNTYKGMIWQQSGITITPGSTYNFQMYVSNIKIPDVPPGADPRIELRIVDSDTGAILQDTSPPPIAYSPGSATNSKGQHPATWQPENLTLTSTTTSHLTLQILDNAGKENDDDFTMTALGLYLCD